MRLRTSSFSQLGRLFPRIRDLQIRSLIGASRLSEDGAIAQMRSVWDGALVDDQTLSILTLAALEPSDN